MGNTSFLFLALGEQNRGQYPSIVNYTCFFPNLFYTWYYRGCSHLLLFKTVSCDRHSLKMAAARGNISNTKTKNAPRPLMS